MLITHSTKPAQNLPNRNAPHSDQHISNCLQAMTSAASSSMGRGSILGWPYQHTAPQHPSLTWDKLEALLPAACPTLGQIIPPPTVPIPQQAGGRDRAVAGELTCMITYQVSSSNTSISIYSQKPSLFTSQITSVNDSVGENHAKIWFLQILNKAIISLVDNEYIFHLILTRSNLIF